MVGYGRRNFLVPIPRVENLAALNAHLEQRCVERMDAVLRGHTETIGHARDLSIEELIAAAGDLSLEPTLQMFSAFGWEPAIDVVRDLQTERLKRTLFAAS